MSGVSEHVLRVLLLLLCGYCQEAFCLSGRAKIPRNVVSASGGVCRRDLATPARQGQVILHRRAGRQAFGSRVCQRGEARRGLQIESREAYRAIRAHYLSSEDLVCLQYSNAQKS